MSSAPHPEGATPPMVGTPEAWAACMRGEHGWIDYMGRCQSCGADRQAIKRDIMDALLRNTLADLAAAVDRLAAKP